MTNDLTISHVDVLHMDGHWFEEERYRVTADTTSMDTTAAPANVRSSSPDVSSRSGLSESPITGHMRTSLSADDLYETLSVFEGPLTRARARAEQTGGGGNSQTFSERQHLFTPIDKSTLQTLRIET
jgi:hypothetical protein